MNRQDFKTRRAVGDSSFNSWKTLNTVRFLGDRCHGEIGCPGGRWPGAGGPVCLIEQSQRPAQRPADVEAALGQVGLGDTMDAVQERFVAAEALLEIAAVGDPRHGPPRRQADSGKYATRMELVQKCGRPAGDQTTRTQHLLIRFTARATIWKDREDPEKAREPGPHRGQRCYPDPFRLRGGRQQGPV